MALNTENQDSLSLPPKGMEITLGRKEPNLKLRFRFRKSPIASKWVSMLQEALDTGIVDRERFANFSSNLEKEIKDCIEDIQAQVQILKNLRPDINFGIVDFSDLQGEVNRLHQNFAHLHLVEKGLDEKTWKAWDRFNSLLHKIEAVLGRKDGEQKTGIRAASFHVGFNSLNRIPLTPEDFLEGSLNRQFGHCYLAYSQVGRHMMEIYFAKDRDVPSEHIQPFRQMSANFTGWFGHNRGDAATVSIAADAKRWFEGEGNEVLRRAGLEWDIFKLGIPEIPVAYLEEPVFSKNEILELQDKISEVQHISDIQLF